MTAKNSELAIEAESPVGEAARRLVAALGAELSERYGPPEKPLPLLDADAERAVFLIARVGARPVGCGALRRIDNDTVEIKRMFVVRAERRRGIAVQIIMELERRAAAFGYRVIRLETGIHQPEARRLYEASGYQRIAPFGPYVGDPISVCYEKLLSLHS